MTKVRFLLCGGTIDKINSEADEKPILKTVSDELRDDETVQLDYEGFVRRFDGFRTHVARETFLKAHFNRHSLAVVPHYILVRTKMNPDDAVFQRLMAIDSLDMTEEHRGQILQAIIDSPEDRIVVTHGTSTMVDTARLVYDFMNSEKGKLYRNKVIVFTGAMTPLSLSNSDGPNNLGYAVSEAKNRTGGVYIAMHNDTFPNPHEITKDEPNSRFVYIDKPADHVASGAEREQPAREGNGDPGGSGSFRSPKSRFPLGRLGRRNGSQGLGRQGGDISEGPQELAAEG
ncbi:MAG: hypothetical protein GC137_04585 [Alphaproteobacteria bacterium]|nr:hypothetical protein [Alphaproteobacteria bacterium]